MRVYAWQEKLRAVLAAAETKNFKWGEHDCVTFASDAMLAMTGRDPIEDLRGQWDSEETAAAKLEEFGGLEGAVTCRVGAPLPTPRFAGHGDVVLTKEGFLAIVMLSYALGPKPQGLTRVEMGDWVTGWRIE